MNMVRGCEFFLMSIWGLILLASLFFIAVAFLIASNWDGDRCQEETCDEVVFLDDYCEQHRIRPRPKPKRREVAEQKEVTTPCIKSDCDNKQILGSNYCEQHYRKVIGNLPGPRQVDNLSESSMLRDRNSFTDSRTACMGCGNRIQIRGGVERAVRGTSGTTAGVAIGTIIGSIILPGVGTLLGAAAGGLQGGEGFRQVPPICSSCCKTCHIPKSKCSCGVASLGPGLEDYGDGY